MNNSFRIIAVRVIEGCSSNVKKILKNNCTYFFYNEYEYDENSHTIKKKSRTRGIPDSFFNVSTDNPTNLKINISAIVGKNGDGKSSLIELILRIINNFAYACGFTHLHQELSPVEGVFGELFYAIGEDIYSIKCENDRITFICTDNNFEIEGKSQSIEFSLKNPQINITHFVKKHAAILFYTHVSNYSLYAYNSEDFSIETLSDKGCWINGLFHKNDGYQTPIVLNPFREKGNIDVNIENHLCKQRLLSMFVDGSITTINSDEKPEGFAYKLESESKLFKKTIGEFVENNIEPNDESFFDVIKDYQPTFLQKIQKGVEHYEFLFSKAKEIVINILEEKDLPIPHTDKKSINDKTRDLDPRAIETINDVINKGYDCLNHKQFERILQIIDTCELWNVFANEKYVNLPSIFFNKKAQEDIEFHTNSVSGIAYHLRNIDSISANKNTIAYHFVNLIFEEVELYFHPEFQQKYILYLLNILSKMEFKQLEAINLCFVTHSPFILSDIPKK